MKPNALLLAPLIVLALARASLAAYPGGVLPISQGGFGSSTKSFLDLTTGQSIAGAKTFSAALTVSTSLAIGGGTPVKQIILYSASITPAAVGSHTASGQSFTVTGLRVATDTVLAVNPPGNTAGAGISRFAVGSDNTLSLAFLNVTAASKTPPSGTYMVLVLRS